MPERGGKYNQIVGIQRLEPSQSQESRLTAAFSASAGATITVPSGFAIIGVLWPSFSTKAVIRFRTAESASGTYRLVRRADGTGNLDLFNGTSGSAAGAIQLTDLAFAKYINVVADAAFGASYTFRFVVKA